MGANKRASLTAADLLADLQDIEVVKARTSLSRATIYRRMALGTFPRQRKTGARTVWAKADIDQFCSDVINGTDMGQSMGSNLAA